MGPSDSGNLIQPARVCFDLRQSLVLFWNLPATGEEFVGLGSDKLLARSDAVLDV
jgi:hypothetical protein